MIEKGSRAENRICAVHFPTLATDRLQRLHGLSGRAVATVEKAKGASFIASANPNCGRIGIAAGQTLAEARALYPDLVALPAEPEADMAALTRIARAADRFTPLVGIDGADGLYLDIRGCAHLFGGEAQMVDDLLSRIRRQGFRVSAAVAPTPALASALSRHPLPGPATPIVFAADQREIIDRLPTEALRLCEATTAILLRLGLKLIGQVHAQPRHALIQRFGPDLARRLDQIEGFDDEPITPLMPVAPFVAERRFAEPLMQLESITASLAPLAAQLCERLQRRGEGALQLTARLFHTDGAIHDASVGASAPLADAVRMVALMTPRLEALAERVEGDSGVDIIRLSAHSTGPLKAAQTDLDGHANAKANLTELVDTLAERLGASAVQRFCPVDSHWPGAAPETIPAAEVPAHPWPDHALPAPHPDVAPPPPDRPLRVFSAPEPIRTMASVPEGPPIRFTWRKITYQVAVAEGPERIAPPWWLAPADGAAPSDAQDDGFLPAPKRALQTRDYFRVEDTEGRRFWLFRQGLYGRETTQPEWFMHGLFA